MCNRNGRSLTSKSLMPATPSAMNEDVVQNVSNYLWNHHSHDPLKIPWLSLTFHNIFNFPWPITKFPDNSLTFAWYGISVTFPYRWTPCAMVTILMMVTFHDDVIKWKHFPRYWPFVRGIHRSTKQKVEQTIVTPVIWNAIALVMVLATPRAHGADTPATMGLANFTRNILNAFDIFIIEILHPDLPYRDGNTQININLISKFSVSIIVTMRSTLPNTSAPYMNAISEAPSLIRHTKSQYM